ncbi:9756_t:CDS:2 [Diversispora eburnea]|uniref:9756_t:CDS:1 n=1 Tax=Diversispora eburnea TaxID=1213867 RepID=A0A9N8Z6T7_9GLOM|nr:9756_t:CDS:2 [Diversispora eburnea]
MSSSISVDEPTQNELANLSVAIQKLWDLDHNRLKPGGENVTISLFQFVSKQSFQIPTIKYFCALLDNYIPQTGIAEKVDNSELKENSQFIKEVMKTAPMKYAYKAKLIKLWFDMYARQGHSGDSSAFEHVFLGEVRDGEAKAFHNWIAIYFYEKAGKFDYKSFVPMKEGNRRLITVSYEKTFSTSFIGTSPEFEISLYTLLFLLGREDTRVTLDDININLKLYNFYERSDREKKNRLLGSAFPMILGPTA